MNHFSHKKTSLSYSYTVEYSVNGISHSTGGDSVLCIVPETEFMGDYAFRTRLKITNASASDVYLENAYPICTDTLSIDNIPSREWRIMNQGRHKNDLPSVFCAGVRDEAFADGVNRLSEEGTLLKNAADTDVVFYGDQISVIHTDGGDVSLYFHSAGTQLTEILICVDAKGNVEDIRVGGAFRCFMKPGDTLHTEWAVLDCREDYHFVIESYAQARASAQNARVAAYKPGVYSTWYYYGRAITEENVLMNIHGIVDKSLPFDCFQIDAGWEVDYGDWEPNGKFPNGIQCIADEIHRNRMIAGLWTCPLIIGFNSSIVKDHPDWLLRHTDGKYCIFSGRDNYILDCTHPQVIEWIENLYRKLTSWGYTYHKLDFTRAFPIQQNVIYHNPYLTPVQAYVNAMKAVRRGIGEESYLLVCGGLYDPLIGICDAQRTSSDVLSHWQNPKSGTPRIPFTVKQNTLRYFMANWWHCDPDSLMVRRNDKEDVGKHLSLGTLNDYEAITFTANQYFGGGIVCSTEAMNLVENDRLYLLRHIMPTVQTKATPMHIFNGDRFIRKINVWVEKGWHTVCFVNWNDEPSEMELSLCELSLDAGKDYHVASFFTQKIFKNIQPDAVLSLGQIPPHATEIIKIAPADVPQIIKSDAHFSMGGELDLILSGESLIAKGKWDYPVDAHYTVALPDGREWEITVSQKGEYTLEFPYSVRSK